MIILKSNGHDIGVRWSSEFSSYHTGCPLRWNTNLLGVGWQNEGQSDLSRLDAVPYIGINLAKQNISFLPFLPWSSEFNSHYTGYPLGWKASISLPFLGITKAPVMSYLDLLSFEFNSCKGVEPDTTYENLGLPSEWYGALEWIFPTWARTHALDRGQAVNTLKGAVVTADRILTVSQVSMLWSFAPFLLPVCHWSLKLTILWQGYSWEITTPEGGYGLHELLSSRKSVLNGMIISFEFLGNILFKPWFQTRREKL